ncbi:hypothetical protein [uncultured Sphingomonas sp.]|uniref:hypothetical protein n=1 Tax=uncultured Sphingomonas sp. TaxID=158754 RepID=UPI0025EDDDC2|nr:hypothetical protein [uncultured Sphingomonas sp.]
MTLHFLHRAVVVPKAPVLFPDKLDDLLAERVQSQRIGDLAYFGRLAASDLVAVHDRWADRLTARIDREDKA